MFAAAELSRWEALGTVKPLWMPTSTPVLRLLATAASVFWEERLRWEDRLFMLLRLVLEARLVRKRYIRLMLVGSEYRFSIVGFSFGTQTKELLRLSLESLVKWRVLLGSRIFLILRRLDRDGLEFRVALF